MLFSDFIFYLLSQAELEARRDYYGEDHRRHREVYSPSNFQREILGLSFEDFITKTNIKDLILNEQRKMRSDENFVLQSAAMHPKLEFFYEHRKRTHEWHKNCLKNLEFKQPPVEPQSEPNRDQSSDVNKNVATDKTAQNPTVPESQANTSKSKGTQDLAKKSKKQKEVLKINDFQREVMALSYEAFINETNIRDIVERDFNDQFKGAKKMNESDMNFGLAHYERLRNGKDPNQWYKSSMTHLKFKVCDCKRHKQFEDASVATDQKAVETREIGCETDSEQHPQLELQLHAIHESQIICIANFSADASESNIGQETNVDEHQGESFRFHPIFYEFII